LQLIKLKCVPRSEMQQKKGVTPSHGGGKRKKGSRKIRERKASGKM